MFALEKSPNGSSADDVGLAGPVTQQIEWKLSDAVVVAQTRRRL